MPPPSFAPPKPACLTPHSVVIIQPTPEIEHKSFLDEENEKKSENQQTETNQNSNIDTNNVVVTEVESCVEINVFESGPQNTSFDTEDEDDRKTEIHVLDKQNPVEPASTLNETSPETEEITEDFPTKKTQETSEVSLPSPPQIDKFEANFDADFEANFEENLPPPPVETSIQIATDEEDEDEQMIVKKLKQLKDDNNNFTSSFDQLESDRDVVPSAGDANFADFNAKFATNFDDIK